MSERSGSGAGGAVPASAGEVETNAVARLEGDAFLGLHRFSVHAEATGCARLTAEDPQRRVHESAGDGVELPLASGVDLELDRLAEPAGLGTIAAGTHTERLGREADRGR